MIYLKILIQLLTGISGLVALLLDYKWHDKRRKIFKTLRNLLIVITVVSLIAGVIITLYDENEKNDEVTNLKNRLDTAQNTLTYIKSNGDTLKSQIKPFLELATQQYPNLSSNEALKKLKNRLTVLDKQILNGSEKLTNLSSELTTEKKTIKTFDVTVSIEFSGKWDNTPYSQWLQPGKPMTLLNWIDNSKKNPDLEFSTSKISYETINSTTGLFKNTLVIQPGQFPLGQLTDILRAYDVMAFWIVLSWPENLLDPKITFNKVDIVFSINGSKNGELHYQPNLSMDYSLDLKALVPGKKSWLQPRMELTGKLIDVLKMSIE